MFDSESVYDSSSDEEAGSKITSDSDQDNIQDTILQAASTSSIIVLVSDSESEYEDVRSNDEVVRKFPAVLDQKNIQNQVSTDHAASSSSANVIMSDSESDYQDNRSTDEEAKQEELGNLTPVLEQDNIQNESSTDYFASCSSENDYYDKLQKLRFTIQLNIEIQEKITKLENLLHKRLEECRKRLAALPKISEIYKPEKKKKIFVYEFGTPYFKDKNNFVAPCTVDTITIQKAGMFNHSNIASLQYRYHPKMHIDNAITPDKVNDVVNENIDLPSTSADTTVKPKVGNDDFMYEDDDDDDDDDD